MSIDELMEKQNELDAAKEKLASLFGEKPCPVADASDQGPWELGKNYLIRTVTYIQTGRLKSVGSNELVLEDASWIPDTGRFADNLDSCDFGEVEPFPKGAAVIIGRASLIDAVQISKLPRSQK